MKNINRDGKRSLSRGAIGTEVPQLVNGKVPVNQLPSLGGGGEDYSQNLFSAEMGLPIVDKPNTIIDPLNDDSGTLTNMAKHSSRLEIDGSNLSGSYERSRKTSVKMGNTDAKISISFQAFKPKEVISSNNIIFQGDVSNYFVVNKDLIIYKIVESDGQKVLQHLIASNNNIAKLNINSSSYDSGNDETTVGIDNPDSLDLNMDLLTNEDVQNYLRPLPFDFVFSAASDDTKSFENLTLADATSWQNGKMGLLGDVWHREEDDFVTGTVYHQDVVFSKNKQYGIWRILENTSGNAWWVYKFTADGGKTWNWFGTGKSSSQIDRGAAGTNDLNYLYHMLHRGQIFIANSGKFITAHDRYQVANTGGNEVWAKYGDLSVVTPTLTDTADKGGGAGVIVNSDTVDYYCGNVIATEDMTWVVFTCYNVNGNLYAFNYSNGGATYDSQISHTSSFYYASGNPPLIATGFSGTSGSYSLYTVYTYDNGTSNLISWHRVDESNKASLAFHNSYFTTSSGINAIMGYTINDSYFVVAVRDYGSDIVYIWEDLSTNTISTGVIFKIGFGFTYMSYAGSDGRYRKQAYIQNRLQMVSDPNDDKHIFLVFEYGDTISSTYPCMSAVICEIEDITEDLNGLKIIQDTYGDEALFNTTYGSPNHMVAQTFQMNSAVYFETLELGFNCDYENTNNVRYPKGKKIWVEIWKTDAGAPDGTDVANTGSLVATSINHLDPLLLQDEDFGTTPYFFNFDRTITLNNGETYALVIKTDMTIDNRKTEFGLTYTASNAYGSGSIWTYDGTSWTAQASGYDLYFQLYKPKMRVVGDWGISGYGHQHRYLPSGNISDLGVSLDLIDDTHIQAVWKRSASHNKFNRYASGHPYRRIITFSSSGQSSWSEEKQIGYNHFDPYLRFETALGSDKCAEIDIDTGLIVAGNQVNDRAGMTNGNTGYSNLTRVADSDFQEGYCMSFNGVSTQVNYGGTAYLNTWDFGINWKDFIIEVEIKGLAGLDMNIISTAEGVHGYELRVLSDGTLRFRMANGSAVVDTITNETINSDYQKLRIVRSSTEAGEENKIRLFYKKSGTQYNVGDVAGEWNEFTYSSQYTSEFSINMGGGDTNNKLYIGGRYGGTNWFQGKIGYVKIAIGNDEFAFDGFIPQPAINNITAPIAEKQKFYGEKITGKIDYDRNVWFDYPVQGDGKESALVDSYMQLLTYDKTSEFLNKGKNLHIKAEKGRGIEDDKSKIEGIIAQFTKAAV